MLAAVRGASPAGPRILPALPERIASAALRLLQSMNVNVRTGARVTEVTEDAVHLGGEQTIPDGIGGMAAGADAGLIQPRAEGEIAFMLKHDLRGPGITRDDVLAATAWVAPCFEVVDSRIRDWQIRIQDTVADNASCGVFVIGERNTDPAGIDLAAVRMRMYRNGEPAGEGLGSAVQGHPAEAVAWLAHTLGRFGIPFLAGEIILSGSLAPLVPARAGDRFAMQIDELGGCSMSFA